MIWPLRRVSVLRSGGDRLFPGLRPRENARDAADESESRRAENKVDAMLTEELLTGLPSRGSPLFHGLRFHPCSGPDNHARDASRALPEDEKPEEEEYEETITEIEEDSDIKLVIEEFKKDKK